MLLLEMLLEMMMITTLTAVEVNVSIYYSFVQNPDF